MLTDWLLDVVSGLLGGFVAALPTVNLDLSALTVVGEYMGWFAPYFDLTAWGATLGIILAVELTLWAVGFVVWIWRMLPFT